MGEAKIANSKLTLLSYINFTHLNQAFETAKGVREPEISGQEHEIFSGSRRVPENFEILEFIGIPENSENPLTIYIRFNEYIHGFGLFIPGVFG
ncbi:hypothetical protein WN51_09012 [Melipona quadrifasciata]|uniref:Uncharacterized protein n=1 Tax=Melipona quadrifasciata TaxID=166423 RepID=A0A0N0U7P5_9HYME|nr:hypothetical protein WN51_09012 [Melipona quadrifasciata]